MNHHHYTEVQWKTYAGGSEIDRALMDEHLTSCELCLERYLQVIESMNDQLPMLSDTQVFAVGVSHHLKAKPNPVIINPSDSVPTRYSKWFMKPVIQYTIAASLTIVLVSTGAFQQLINSLSELTTEAEQGSTAVITEQLTEKADRLLDRIPAKYANKKEGIQ